ncbi:MAG: 2-C-methyl-D-erythritol 2,4-cyclodiphosphate synthase [Phycisphaerae bacterium]|nr:2-C-methyl-D-erythritol 2,4-cyclodiphosphate synthase [Phycisphaerae bacterium]
MPGGERRDQPAPHEPAPFRIGHGYDLHRLEPCAPLGAGRPFVLGGVAIAHDRGPVGHSDGDALLHAATDAILGALGLPDIGQLFPDTDAKWEGQDSSLFAIEAARRMRDAGWDIGNMDMTVVCERPKIGPHKQAIVACMSKMLGVSADRLNLKGKTHEKVDAVGEGRAIEVHVSVLLCKR